MKNLILIFLLIISLNSYAAPTFSNMDSQCGDPRIGQFTCDLDSIRVTYGYEELKNNNWVNTNANSEDIFVSGPILNLDTPDFKSLQITASINIIDYIFIPTYIDYCKNPSHVFDIDIIAKDGSNNKVILSTNSVSLTQLFFYNNASRCNFNGTKGPGNLNFEFIKDIDPSKYHDFQIVVKNLTLPSGTFDKDTFSSQVRLFYLIQDNKWYLQIVGVK